MTDRSVTSALLAGLAWLSGFPVWAEPVTVPFDPEYPPMSEATVDGAEGFDIQVARKISEVMGADIHLVPSDFLTIQSGDWPDDWDFTVSSTSLSQERQEAFRFVGPYYYAAVVLVQLATPEEADEEDEAGGTDGSGAARAERQDDGSFVWILPEASRIGVCDGCIYKDYIEGNYLSDGEAGTPPLGVVDVVPFLFETDILRALVGDGGEIDFAITSAAFAQHFRDIGFPLEQVGPPLFVEPLYITQPVGVDEGKAQLLDDAYLAVARSGFIREASQTYLGGDFTPFIEPEGSE